MPDISTTGMKTYANLKKIILIGFLGIIIFFKLNLKSAYDKIVIAKKNSLLFEGLHYSSKCIKGENSKFPKF